MKLYLYPPSPRVLGIIALKNHLGLECELRPIDLNRGEHRAPDYVAVNPNGKIPALEDEGFVLWESNAILFYLAAKRPESGLWPSDLPGQANVMRWLAWESAHWDAESCGMVAFEKVSRPVFGAGAADAAFVARGEQNFARFAAVLDQHLQSNAWVTGDRLTIADFSIGGLVPIATTMKLPVERFTAIGRWYAALAALPGWREAVAAKDAAVSALLQRLRGQRAAEAT
jgi:glutathione S-transferase